MAELDQAGGPARLTPEERRRTVQRGILLAAGALVPILLALLFLEAAQAFLLIFAGYLVGVLLRLPSEWLARRTGLSHPVSFFLVLAGTVGLLVLAGALAAPRVAEQARQLSEELPRAVEGLVAELEGAPGVPWLEARLAEQREGEGGPAMIDRALGLFSTVLGALTGLVILLWAGIYFGSNPGLYRRGILALVPRAREDRVAEVLAETDDTLGHWMLGQLASMAVVGVLTWIGLLALGIPLAFLLALIAALLTIVPNFGPIASVLPPALLALADSPTRALWVVLLFLAIQTVESYVITPLIQKQAISMPPALILVSQVVLASLFGFLGLLVAMPLAAAAMVLIGRLYVEDALGKEGDVEAA